MLTTAQTIRFYGRSIRLGVLIVMIASAVLFAPGIVARSMDEETRKVTLTMSEYAFVVDGQQPGTPLVLKAGELTDLTLKNTGSLVHEIWWGKNPQIQEGRVDGYSIALFDGVGMTITGRQGAPDELFEIDTESLTEIALKPGQSMTLEFTLPPTAKGTWEMGCFQPMPMAATPSAATQASDKTGTPVPVVSHYNVNMKLPLIVQ